MDFVEKYKIVFTPIILVLNALFWFTVYLLCVEYLEWICLSFGYEVEGITSIYSIFQFIFGMFLFIVGIGSTIGIAMWGLKNYI